MQYSKSKVCIAIFHQKSSARRYPVLNIPFKLMQKALKLC